MHDLIMGTLQGYRHMPPLNISHVLPYVASIQNNVGNAKRIMFVNRVPHDVVLFLKQSNFEVIEYQSYTGRASRLLRQALNGACSRLPNLFGWHYQLKKYFWHCQASRYFLYRDYLSKQRDICQVVISDVRDVIFQRDPFCAKEIGSSQNEKFFTSEEHRCRTIDHDPSNRNLICSLFGRDRLNELGDMPIICSGVSMGNSGRMLEYLNLMTNRLLHSYEPVGYDQGIHIDIIYRKALAGVHVFRYGEGPIVHLAIAPRDEIRTNAEGEIIDKQGEVIPIVHQYDRHQDLTIQIFSRFSD